VGGSANISVLSPGPLYLQVSVKPADLLKMARVANVKGIQRVRETEFDDIPACDIICGEALRNATELKGEGEVIVVADSGFHLGVDAAGKLVADHPVFSARVAAVEDAMLIAPNAQRKPETWSLADNEYHGTRVAGCALGMYRHPNRFEKDLAPNTKRVLDVQGPAPKATLVAVKVDDRKDPDVDKDLNGLFAKFFTINGVKQQPNIYNCSFSSGMAEEEKGPKSNRVKIKCRAFETVAQNALDALTSLRKQTLITVSAGNHGLLWLGVEGGVSTKRWYRQIHDTSAAKNVLTVGWTYNRRLFRTRKVGNGEWTGVAAGEPDPAKKGMGLVIDTTCDDGANAALLKSSGNESTAMSPTQLALLSSKGPTAAGYLKPDVVAPGAGILSARPFPDSATTKFESQGTCPTAPLAFRSGSSQAAPMVAGCAAVIREALRTRANPALLDPTAALLKAIIVNGAVDLAGGPLEWWDQTLHTRVGVMPPSPNCAQGFGQVNLMNSLACVFGGNGSYFQDRFAIGTTGSSKAVAIPPPKDTARTTLRLTLVFHDEQVPKNCKLALSVTATAKGATKTFAPDPIQPLPWDDATKFTTWLETNSAKQVVQRITIPRAIDSDKVETTVSCESNQRGDELPYAVCWYWMKP